MIKSFIKKNVDILSYLIILTFLALGIFLKTERLFSVAYILAIFSMLFAKSPFSTKVSKDTDERDLYIVAKSTNKAYVFILLFVLFWEIFIFENNIFALFNLDVHSTIKIVLAVIYFSYGITFSYYKRKL